MSKKFWIIAGVFAICLIGMVCPLISEKAQNSFSMGFYFSIGALLVNIK